MKRVEELNQKEWVAIFLCWSIRAYTPDRKWGQSRVSRDKDDSCWLV